jgi:hypothetical protein
MLSIRYLTFLKIQAVRIACEGEVRELDVPKFQSATLAVHDPVFRGMNHLLNLPLIPRRDQALCSLVQKTCSRPFATNSYLSPGD